MGGKKKFNSLEELGGLVYSTGMEIRENIRREAEKNTVIKAYYSKKGRGGKTATVLKGFRMPDHELKILAKRLKQKLGTGGSVKNGEIIIQGDIRDKVIRLLESEGYTVKKAGG